jgi:hypothetical protein
MRAVSRRVLRVASEVLRSSQEDTATPAAAATTSTIAPEHTTGAPPLPDSEVPSSARLQLEGGSVNNSITFEDSLGKKFEIPFDEVRTWDASS